MGNFPFAFLSVQVGKGNSWITSGRQTTPNPTGFHVEFVARLRVQEAITSSSMSVM
jgi:hypothetical protein